MKPRWGSPLVAAFGFGIQPWAAVTGPALDPVAFSMIAIAMLGGAIRAWWDARRHKLVPALEWAAVTAGVGVLASVFGLDPVAWTGYALAAGLAGPIAAAFLALVDRRPRPSERTVLSALAACAVAAAAAWTLTA